MISIYVIAKRCGMELFHAIKKNARGSRNVLTAAQALEIFGLKDGYVSCLENCITRANPKNIAMLYGVSRKTVKDIWIGRTWFRTTHILDPNRTDATHRLDKRPGRPKGAKDRKPRNRPGGLNLRSRPKFIQRHSEFIETQDSALILDNKYQNNLHINVDLRVGQEASIERSTVNHDVFLDPDSEGKYQDFVDPFHDDWPYW